MVELVGCADLSAFKEVVLQAFRHVANVSAGWVAWKRRIVFTLGLETCGEPSARALAFLEG